MENELIELDLNAAPEREVRERQVREPSVNDGLEREARRTAKVCERLLGRARVLIQYNLLSYDEMNLVLRMEDYYKRNKHLGVHWLKQLYRLIRRNGERLVEAQMSANLLD